MTTLTYPLPHAKSYGSSPLVSTVNFYEHELIFFSPLDLFQEMNANQLVNENVYANVVSRMEELTKWVEAGHTLIGLDLYPAPFQYVHLGRAVPESVENFQPFKQVQLTAKSG